MKKLIITLLCIGLFIIDTTCMPFIEINNVFPSILFCFVVSFALINGGYDALFAGAISGLLQDIYFPYAFGVNAFANCIICYIAALWGEALFKNKKVIPVLIMGLMTIVKYIIMFIVMYCIDIQTTIDFNVIIMAVYNMIVTMMIYKSVYKFANKDEIKKQWSFADK